jgi:hypothetical protein
LPRERSAFHARFAASGMSDSPRSKRSLKFIVVRSRRQHRRSNR